MRQLTLYSFLLISIISIGQNSTSPYEWDWTRDGIWTGAALAGSVGGVLIIGNKDEFTDQELLDFKTKIDDINGIDRWAAGNYSEQASKISDIPFYLSFAAPFALLFDDKMNDHSGQLFGIYIQSLATTSALFTVTAGLTNRARPYVYSNDPDSFERQRSTSATRSFYSGHVAATTTATFFAAKAYQDFNPDSPAIPYIWTGAAVLPAAVGYLRMEAGQHFLTDVLLGYGLGALAGYYIPELHKKQEDSNIGFTPIMGRDDFGGDFQGFSLSYSF
jgi:membrane-associated phospholipid phosphatase